jgi:hypothetical protein
LEPPPWLQAWQRHGTTTAEALARFDALSAAAVESCLGRWRGSGLPTGHPLDGLLEALGWWGKDFVDADTVHPLLFRDRAGRVAPLAPVPFLVRWILRHPGPMRGPAARAAFAAAQTLLRTTRPQARLRAVAHRGVVGAAMIYDALPIIDHFRMVDPDTLLGLMDLRGMAQPYFFLLRREGAA